MYKFYLKDNHMIIQDVRMPDSCRVLIFPTDLERLTKTEKELIRAFESDYMPQIIPENLFVLFNEITKERAIQILFNLCRYDILYELFPQDAMFAKSHKIVESPSSKTWLHDSIKY